MGKVYPHVKNIRAVSHVRCRSVFFLICLLREMIRWPNFAGDCVRNNSIVDRAKSGNDRKARLPFVVVAMSNFIQLMSNRQIQDDRRLGHVEHVDSRIFSNHHERDRLHTLNDLQYFLSIAISGCAGRQCKSKCEIA